MKILFLDAYFEPEQIAFTHLEKDLQDTLIENGNEITVICPVPTRGVTLDTVKQYKDRKTEYLSDRKIHVKRFAAPREGKNPLIRAFRYFWCNFRTFQMGVREKDCDIVFCNSTPPTQGWIAGQVARRLRTPFVYSLQDIFPDSLITTGLTKRGSIIWKIGRTIERRTYHFCDRIIVITKSMKENLLSKNVPEKKISIISNWIDTDKVKPIDRKENQLFDEFGIDRSKFIVLYAGNFGEAQGADIILSVAEKMQDKENVHFVIFGGGSGYEKIHHRSKDLNNVFVHPLMPQNRIAEVYSMGNIAIITARKGVGASGMPSKTWSIMACNTRIVASYDLNSDLCEMILESKAGVCVEPENAEALEKAILAEIDTQSTINTDSRSEVIQIASKEVCTMKYLKAFEEACLCQKGCL